MDIDYNELFGVTPEDTGENEQEVTDPAGDTRSESGSDSDTGRIRFADSSGSKQTIEEPETDTRPESDSDSGTERIRSADSFGSKPDSGSSASPESDQDEQTPEENAKYAAARRKAEKERDDAIAAEQARSEAAMQEIFAKSGFVNPYTHMPIKNKAEFDAYINQRDQEAQKEAAAKRDKELRKAGLSQETIDGMINEHPAVKQAREMAQREMTRVQQERAAAAKRMIDEDVAQIAALDPDVKTIEDVFKSENANKVLDLTRRGYRLSDAYRIINNDKIVERQVNSRLQAATQAEINKKASKDHLKATGKSKTGGEEPLSQETINSYRLLMPNATIEQIKAYEAKYKNKKG